MYFLLPWNRVLLAVFAASFLVGCSGDAGPPIPAIVKGDSMAPTVCGHHLKVSCTECQFEFRTELIEGENAKVTCPNCGQADLQVADAQPVASPQVQLRPYAKPPRRWDVIGFQLPKEASEGTGIKRVVGLPGDEIEIRAGDIWMRNKILRKSWRTQKQARIPVFDSKFNAVVPFDNKSRFRASDNPAQWTIRNDSFRFASAKNDRVGWLDYVQWRNCRNRGIRDKSFPIEDSYAHNQSTSRELNRVDDLFLELEAEFEIGSTMVLAFRRKQAEFNFEIARSETEFKTSWKGSSKRKPLVLQPIYKSDLPKVTIEFSSFDRTLNLRLDGTNVFELREDENATDTTHASVFDDSVKIPFRIGAKTDSLRVNRIRIWRDIYYLNSPVSFVGKGNTKLAAGPGEYIVLGDNSPRSLDSRTWKNPGIPLTDILGKLDLDESAARFE